MVDMEMNLEADGPPMDASVSSDLKREYKHESQSADENEMHCVIKNINMFRTCLETVKY